MEKESDLWLGRDVNKTNEQIKWLVSVSAKLIWSRQAEGEGRGTAKRRGDCEQLENWRGRLIGMCWVSGPVGQIDGEG